MAIWEALILGIIQGIFMFFPVSSTSHLVLVQHWLLERGAGFPFPDSPEMIAFDLVVHVGTVVSIIFVFRKSLVKLVQKARLDFAKWKRGEVLLRETLHLKLMGLGLFAVAITGIVGLPLKSLLEKAFAHPLFIAQTLAITGILLWATDILPPRPRGLRNLGLWLAFIIGLAQALALLPGISRSGITIVVALLGGLKRRWAAEFSFFIAIPTILGAAFIHGLEIHFSTGLAGLDWTALVVGFLTAAVVGIIALHIVITLLYRAQFRFFSYYVWTLAAIIVILHLFNS